MKSPIKNQINTTFVHVSDLPRSVKWYSELMGLAYDLDKIAEPIYNFQVNHYTGLLLDAGEPGKRLSVHPSAHPLFNLHTDDVHAAFQYASDLGCEIVSDIVVFDDISFFNIKDPDGNIVMVCTG